MVPNHKPVYHGPWVYPHSTAGSSASPWPHGLLDGHLGIMDVGLVVKDKILMIDLGT